MPHVHCPSLTSLCFVLLSAVSSGCFVINLNISCLRKSKYLTTKNMPPIITNNDIYNNNNNNNHSNSNDNLKELAQELHCSCILKAPASSDFAC